MRRKLSRIKAIIIHFFTYYLYDAKVFYKNSMLQGYETTQARFIGRITLFAHVIEKGLTMPNMRPNFGKDNLYLLMELLVKYQQKGYDITHPLFKSALEVVYEYENTHKKLHIDLDSITQEKIASFRAQTIEPEIIEQPKMTKEEFFKDQPDFASFAHSRYSVRNFLGSVSLETIEKAVALAQTAPSACNRQPNRVHVISKGSLFDAILSIQHGNRGFGFLADKLLVVTSDTSSYLLTERNGMYVDGGIYVMNLLYALHYYKIAACTLNWFANAEDDKKLRELLRTNEQAIVILAIGDVPQEFACCRSQRIGTNRVLTIH